MFKALFSTIYQLRLYLIACLGGLFLLCCTALSAHAQYEKLSLSSITGLCAEARPKSQIKMAFILSESDDIFYADSLYRFYSRRSFTPIWTLNSQIPAQTLDFLNCIAGSKSNGLLPEDYHYEAIARILGKASSEVLPTDTLLNLDLLLSDAFLLMAKHYSQGKVNPDKANVAWHLTKRYFNPVSYFEKVLRSGQNICTALESLLPAYSGYKDLKNMLAEYEQMGDWGELPNRYSLYFQKGDADPVIAQVKERLRLSGDYPSTASLDMIFNKELETAVMNFQRRHGLHYDGIVRYTTVQMLNVPRIERLRQIKANLERWRWVPEQLGNRYILVNIPSFELEMLDNGQTLYRENIIVGRENYPTPSFSDSITYIVFNPFWYMPKSIAEAELKPALQFDPDYLVNNDVKVFKGGKRVDPSTVNWSKANWNDYTFAQGPSAYNPMGVVKFMFPNKYDIYIHDTPSRDLFNNSRRSYSHGCIRVNDPVKFAAFLLKNNPDWDTTSIKKVLFNQKETKVNLNKAIPIHLMYWTAYMDKQTALVNFREDLYKWDAQLYEALNKRLGK